MRSSTLHGKKQYLPLAFAILLFLQFTCCNRFGQISGSRSVTDPDSNKRKLIIDFNSAVDAENAFKSGASWVLDGNADPVSLELAYNPPPV